VDDAVLSAEYLQRLNNIGLLEIPFQHGYSIQIDSSRSHSQGHEDVTSSGDYI
jgi:hypothetical protein